MRAAYVGILTPGTTSRMRAEWLRRLTPGWQWTGVDTDVPMRSVHRLWQSLAFRFKVGPAVEAINQLVERETALGHYDLIWLDKAVFLRRATVIKLRQCSGRLVHFTPDTAFHANRSAHFNRTLPLYDLVVTTKSFEFDQYLRRIDRAHLLLTTQAFDPEVHVPRMSQEQRRREVVFVGLAEPDRERCLSLMLDQGISVRLGGYGWTRFVKRHRKCRRLQLESESVFGPEYATMLSRAWIGLGLLSKRFPELHTTRTFEIPACGTILATERNSETTGFFGADEALLCEDYPTMAQRIRHLFAADSDEVLARMAGAGRLRVQQDGRDYPSVVRKVLAHPALSGAIVTEAESEGPLVR